MSSSAQEQHYHHQRLPSNGATTAPPPTPTTQNDIRLPTPNAADDTLSRVLHRLPPTLSLPPRLAPPATSPPVICLSPPLQDNPNLPTDLLSASSKQGFFQVTNHPIPSKLALSAELESLSLIFDLPSDKKQNLFQKNWPLGFDEDDEDDGGGDGSSVSLCLSARCPSESNELNLSSLTEFAQALEKVGLEIVEKLSTALGFANPFRLREEENEGAAASASCPWRSLVWLSSGVAANKPVFNGRFYPYVVSLQYQIRCRKHSLLSDSGWVSVSPQVDSILVTVGDIAQVWSNGKLKKVRGTAVASLGQEDDSRSVSVSLLITLPLEQTLFPLIPFEGKVDGGDGDDDDINTTTTIHTTSSSGNSDEKEELQSSKNGVKGKKIAARAFKSFPLEDYAWRAYHERLLFKDPLDRYRI